MFRTRMNSPGDDRDGDRQDPVGDRPPQLRRVTPGLWLRKLSGVDEELLDRVPQERARYTSLGGVVLGTATIAGISMWFAISQVIGYSHPLMLFPVLVWALFILNFDRWLVSSALGSGWQRRLPALLMRLVLAVFLGVVIAEPLVLRIFEIAVEQHVRDERAAARDELRSVYVACNPGTDAGRPEIDCDEEHILTFERSPTAVAAELAAREGDATDLREVIEADQRELRDLNALARRECTGDEGAELTGDFGEGPACERLRDEADDFAATARLAEKESELADLDQRIDELRRELRTADERFVAARDEQIRAAIDERLDRPGDPIGFVERVDALHTLAATSPGLGAASWAVRLFFILVDCLPVLIKVLGGQTSYDRLVANRLAAGERWYETELDAESDRVDRTARRHRAEWDLAAREHTAELDMRLADTINRLADRYARTSTDDTPDTGRDTRDTDHDTPDADDGTPADADPGRPDRPPSTGTVPVGGPG